MPVATCPECGTPASERGVPRAPGWMHWRRLIPALAALVVLVAIATVAWRGWERSTYGPIASYARQPQFTQPFFTAQQVREIAAGTRESNGALTRAVLEQSNPWLVRPPGEEYLIVQFHPGDGLRMVRRAYGRPVPVVITNTTTDYMNVRDQTPIPEQVPTLIRANPSAIGYTEWLDGRIIMMRPGQSGATQRRHTTINVVALAGLLVIPIAAWYAGALGAWLATRKRGTPTRRAGLVVRAAAAGVALLIVLALSLTPRETVMTTPGSSAYIRGLGISGTPQGQTRAMMRLTDLTYGQLAGAAGSAGADQRLAAAIIDAFTREPPDDWQLCAAFVEDSARGGTDGGVWSPWPLLRVQWVHRWRHKPQLDAELSSYTGLPTAPQGTVVSPTAPRVTWPAAGMTCRLRDGELQVALPRASPTQELRAVMIQLDGVIACAAAMWIAWALARRACERRAAMVTRRRAAAGECVVCGYSLAGCETAEA